MKVSIKYVLALMAAPAILALATAPAHAAVSTWDLTRSTGDISGAWARGTYWETSDNRWHLKGELMDTVSDNKGAALRLWAHYTDDGVRPEEVWNTKGHDKDVPIGEYNFASNLDYIDFQECLLVRKADGSIVIGTCASGYTLNLPN
jgi:hypothetical protein